MCMHMHVCVCAILALVVCEREHSIRMWSPQLKPGGCLGMWVVDARALEQLIRRTRSYHMHVLPVHYMCKAPFEPTVMRPGWISMAGSSMHACIALPGSNVLSQEVPWACVLQSCLP